MCYTTKKSLKIKGDAMLNNKNILLVDENQDTRTSLKLFLEKEGSYVLEAHDGARALEIFQSKQDKIDLIIMEIVLPIYDGWTVCREIRKRSTLPILILTARNADFDEIHGFEVGADDYLRKPTNPSILAVRIKALLRRSQLQSNHCYQFPRLELDTASHIVRVSGQEICLSPKEFQILLTLIENQGRIVSREELLHKVWGYDYYTGIRTVDTHMNRLRDKMGEAKDYIHTIRGYGYRFDGSYNHFDS